MTVGIYFLTFLTALLASIPALHTLSYATQSPKPTFIARLIAAYLSITAVAIYGVVASIALRLAGYGGLCQWAGARAFKWTMWVTTGVTFEIEDKVGGLDVRPAVFVGNHQTELDVLMLGCMFPKYCSITAKSTLKYMPFVGQFMTLSKAVFINRASSKESRAVFDSAVETMHKDRQSVYIFPEGTRSYSEKPEMLPFKKGAFHLAIQAQVPIVPVVVANYSNILSVKRWTFNSGTVPVSVCEPIQTKGMQKEDVDSLMKKVRAVMEAELVRISKRATQTGVARPGEAADGLTNGHAVKMGL